MKGLSDKRALLEIGAIPRRPWWTAKKRDYVIGFIVVVILLGSLFYAPG
ncbi:hypothetical protein KW799_00245 [Candidatus Parcubacteria bacterium]|nr:hypothetical protein [Candidatus Parcubacteria bacterium]